MKSLSDTTYSNLDNNVKGNRISIKHEDEIQISNLHFDGSNLVQNVGEYQVVESQTQIKYINQRQQAMTNRLKLISQNSIVLKSINDNQMDLKVDIPSQLTIRRSEKQTSMQMIPINQKGYQESFKSSMIGLNKANYAGYRSSQPATIQLDLKLLAKIKKQMIYFFQAFTDKGRRIHLERKAVRDLIADKSDVFQDKSNKCLYLLYKLVEYVYAIQSQIKFCKYIPMINPDGVAYFLILFFFVFYNTMFYILYTLFGIFKAPAQFDDILDKVTAFIWISEIFLKLNTRVYINKQTLSINRKEICRVYFKKRFFFDIVPLILLMFIPNQKYYLQMALKLVVFLKFKNLFQDIEIVQKYLCMTFQNYYIIQLVNLIVKLFIIGHTIACFWYLIGIIELDYVGEPQTWFENGVGVDGTWWKLYQEALFWSFTLLTTGSNTATTVLQLFFTSFIMLFTTIVFGYMLNVIGFILEELDTKDENKRRDLNVINQYMRQKKISKNLQRKVNNDIEYFYEKNFKKFEEDSQQVLDKISKELNEQLQEEYNKQIIGQIPLLKNNFTKEALDRLYNTFEEAVYFPNQIIQAESDTNDLYLMFIVQGQVEVSQCFSQDPSKQKKIIQYKKNSIIGAYSFFTGMSRQYRIKSAQFTKIIKIRRENFINTIKRFEKDFQVFCQIKDRLMFDSNFVDINHSCLCCEQKSHFEGDCPFVHMNRQHLTLKTIFSKGEKHERKKVGRKEYTVNSISNNNQIREQIQLFIQDQTFEYSSDDDYDYGNQISQNSDNSSYNENDANQIKEFNEELEQQQNKQFSSISVINYDEEVNLKKIEREALRRKLKPNEYFAKESTRIESVNHSPQVMMMNSRQKYFAEMQRINQNLLNNSFNVNNFNIFWEKIQMKQSIKNF